MMMALVSVGCQRAAPTAPTNIAEATDSPRVAPVLPVVTPTAEASPSRSTDGQMIFNGPRDRPRVALTFDSNMTPFMLRELESGKVEKFYNQSVVETLAATNTKATFFLAGLWVERYPDESRAIASNPLFEIASHSYSHRSFHAPCYGLGGAMSFEEQKADVGKSLAQLYAISPRASNFFRFPGGCYDDESVRAASEAGAQCVQYDVVGGDAFGTSKTAIVRAVVDGAENGSIVVMHVTGGNTAPHTGEALPEVISGLRARGFELVTVGELLGRK